MHVLWDWNGTLLDDAWLCVEVVNRLRAARRMQLATIRKAPANTTICEGWKFQAGKTRST